MAVANDVVGENPFTPHDQKQFSKKFEMPAQEVLRKSI
jgi:hypothetical protein